jgi:hypothetical protein
MSGCITDNYVMAGFVPSAEDSQEVNHVYVSPTACVLPMSPGIPAYFLAVGRKPTKFCPCCLSIALCNQWVTYRKHTILHSMLLMASRYRASHLSCSFHGRKQDKIWISGVDGAAKKKVLKKLGITHVLNMSGPEVYSLASVPAEQAYHPKDFTYKVLVSPCMSMHPAFCFSNQSFIRHLPLKKIQKHAKESATHGLPWYDTLRSAICVAT